MMKKLMVGLAVVWFAFGAISPAGALENRFGLGANYWHAIETPLGDFTQDTYSWLASYQLCPSEIFRIEANLEMFPDGILGVGGTAYAPEAFLILGRVLYAGVGIGIFYQDSLTGDDWAQDPFYMARVGVDLPIIQDRLYLDLNGRYQLMYWDAQEVDADIITLGGALRYQF